MENNSMNQNADPAADQGTGEKTFTQEDVNRIVQERLAKEKSKNSNEADFAKREQELEQRELKLSAKEMLSEKGLPLQLLDALNCTDEKVMKKSIEIIETVLNEYKGNAIKNMKFKGFQPGVSAVFSDTGNMPTDADDLDIRKAMGLH